MPTKCRSKWKEGGYTNRTTFTSLATNVGATAVSTCAKLNMLEEPLLITDLKGQMCMHSDILCVIIIKHCSLFWRFYTKKLKILMPNSNVTKGCSKIWKSKEVNLFYKNYRPYTFCIFQHFAFEFWHHLFSPILSDLNPLFYNQDFMLLILLRLPLPKQLMTSLWLNPKVTISA